MLTLVIILKIYLKIIANVILHEKKNFSNSPFILRSGLNIYLDRRFYGYQYSKLLKKYVSKVSKEMDIPYISIGSSTVVSTDWNLEIMTKLPYLLVAIGKELGIDISCPNNSYKPYIKEASYLNDYESDF